MITPRRRNGETPKDAWESWIITLAKTAISLFFLRGLSFVGTWAVGMASTVAAVRDDVQMLKEKERMTTEMIYPQLMDQVKQLREDIKDLRGDLKGKKNARSP